MRMFTAVCTDSAPLHVSMRVRVIEALIWYFRIDIPPSQSRSRQDVLLSSPSDACQELKSSKAAPNTSHTLSKHDTSRVFIGQPRVPMRLKKNL